MCYVTSAKSAHLKYTAAEAVNLTQCSKIKLAHSGARSLFLARSTRRQCVCSADGWESNTIAAVLPLSENVGLCSYLSTSVLFHLMPPYSAGCAVSRPHLRITLPRNSEEHGNREWYRLCNCCNKLTRYSTSRPASCGGTEIDSLHCAIIQRSGASSWPAFPEHLTS